MDKERYPKGVGSTKSEARRKRNERKVKNVSERFSSKAKD